MPIDVNLRYLVRFLVAFAALFLVLDIARVSPSIQTILNVWSIEPARWLLNDVLGSGGTTARDGNVLAGAGVRLTVLPSCDGIDALLLLAAAISATTESLCHRVWGLLIALLVVTAMNTVRLAGLHYCLRVAPGQFAVMHGVISPLLTVVVMALVFWFWRQGVCVATAEGQNVGG